MFKTQNLKKPLPIARHFLLIALKDVSFRKAISLGNQLSLKKKQILMLSCGFNGLIKKLYFFKTLCFRNFIEE